MSPDDPRHGTYAGASAHWKDHEPMCGPCSLAASRTRKRNRYLRETGRPQFVELRGTVRRIQALRAIGWSVVDVSRATGIAEKTLRNPSHRGRFVHRDTFTAVAEAYERLCMTIPDGGYHTRTRRMAAAAGYAPPLAWDDIDTDDAPSTASHRQDRTETGSYLPQSLDDVDEVAVQRILAGDWRLPCTKAEKIAVLDQFPGSHNELERLTGWKSGRYLTRELDDDQDVA